MAYEKVKMGQTVDENNQIINNNFDESVNIAEKGIPDGIATLDSSGKVPSAQLPDIPMTTKDIKMTGYAKPSATSAIVPADSADAAIGKLERKADDHGESLIQAVIQISGNIAGLSTSITNINNDIININTDINQLRADIDSNKSEIGTMKTNINGLNGRIDTLEQNVANANTTIITRLNDIDEIIQDYSERITTLERNSTDMLITTTETADTLTIQTNPLDTLFYAMTVYGKTTQIGTPSPDNPAPIVGAVNPTVSIAGKNLFDVANTNILSAYSSGSAIAANANMRMIYIPCLPNTQYTVSKMATARFEVFETTDKPVVGGVIYNVRSNHTALSISITTTSTSKYLCVWLYNSTYDTMTPDSILQTLQIEMGAVATTHERYVTPQSVILDGITLNSIDAASLIDTIEIDTVANSGVDKVTLTHKVAMMTDLNLFGIYPSGTTTTHTSIYIPTNEYLLGASNVLCNLLPNTVDGGNGYVTTALAQNRIFISNVPNTLTGINGGDTTNNKANALKTWLLARGIKILYVPKEATVTDITETPLGQALLGLRAYKGTTVIQFSNGATGNITYNRSANATIAELSAAVNAIIDGN